MSETESRYDELTEDQIAELLEQGASFPFVRLAMHDAEGERNSVRENAEAVLEYGRTSFGSFGNYMWDGDLYNAMKHADGSNTNLMMEAFGLTVINAHARAEHDKDGYKVNDTGRVVYK